MSEPTVDLQSVAPGERTYRVLRFDKRGGILSTEIIAADSDEQASVIAQTLQDGYGLELWERTKLLAHYPHCAALGA